MLGVVSRILWPWCHVSQIVVPAPPLRPFPDHSFGPLLHHLRDPPGVWTGIELEGKRLVIVCFDHPA